MSDAQSRLSDAADKAEIGADILQRVAEGDENTEVPTAGGVRPSVAKWFKDRYGEFYDWSAGILSGNLAAAERAEAGAGRAELARDALLLSRGIWPTTAAGIGQGVAGVASIVPGSGGANGTFALGLSGGTQVIAPQGYFVVAGGSVTQVVITYPGYYSAGTPTLSFAASSGLTGASATAVMSANTPVGGYFSTPAAPNYAQLYQVAAGPVAVAVGSPYPNKAIVANGLAAGGAAIAILRRDTSPSTIGPTLATPALTSGPEGHAVHNGVSLSEGWLDKVTLRRTVQGSGTLDLLILSGSLSTSMAVVGRRTASFDASPASSVDIVLIAGRDFDPIYIASGSVLGVYVPAGGTSVGGVSGGARYYYVGDPGDTMRTYIPSGQTLQINAEIRPDRIEAETQARRLYASSGRALAALRESAAPSRPRGPSPAAGGGFSAEGATTLFGSGSTAQVVDTDGVVLSVSFWVSIIGSGGFEFVFAETPGSPHIAGAVIRVRRSVYVNKTGLVTLVAGRDFDPINVRAGWYPGIVVPMGGPRFALTFLSGASYVYTGDPGVDLVTYAGNSSRLECVYSIQPHVDAYVRPWQGRNAALLGDSITQLYAGTWTPTLIAATGLTVAQNFGVNGQVLRTMADSLTAGNMAGVDLALVGTGVNDWHHGSAVAGSPSDSAAMNSIYGAVRNIVEKIHAANPAALPVFWGPFNTGKYLTGPNYNAVNPNGLTISIVSEAMLDACRRLGVPMYDTQSRSGVNDMNLTTYLPDNIHPNALLGRRHGFDFGQFINSVWPRS